jgi:GNAT superfamily N-acetyltransferase
MRSAITVRTATREDVPVLLHHRREMFRAMGFTDPGVLESLEALTEQYFRDALQDGTFHGWLAVDAAGTVVGGGGVSETLMPPGPFSPTPTRPEILNVYVEPAYRRQGIARQLMEVMIDWCRARGFGSVFLHASDEGRPLYASMGFEPTPEMRLRIK